MIKYVIMGKINKRGEVIFFGNKINRFIDRTLNTL